MALRELSSLEKYLELKKPNKYSTQGDKKVPVLQSNNGAPQVGLVTIACYLVKEAKRSELLGNSAESRAVVQQWLEYRVTRLNGCAKDDVKTILKELNLYLQDKTYLAGKQFTLADILMYYGIHPLIVDLTVQEKEQHVNVTRWFDHIQHYPGIRRHLPSSSCAQEQNLHQRALRPVYSLSCPADHQTITIDFQTIQELIASVSHMFRTFTS